MKEIFENILIFLLCYLVTVVFTYTLLMQFFNGKVFWAEYDRWIGLYIDRKNYHKYLFMVPCLGIRLEKKVIGKKLGDYKLAIKDGNLYIKTKMNDEELREIHRKFKYGVSGRIVKEHIDKDGVKIVDEFKLDSLNINGNSEDISVIGTLLNSEINEDGKRYNLNGFK